MCGRYGMIYVEQIESRFGIDKFEIIDKYNNYNVAPTQKMPVVRQHDDGKHLELMRWGMHRMLGNDVVRELINTRADKAFGGFWKKQVTTQRVLVPGFVLLRVEDATRRHRF
jgi:putative SOS response-associated peptidase YedK